MDIWPQFPDISLIYFVRLTMALLNYKFQSVSKPAASCLFINVDQVYFAFFVLRFAFFLARPHDSSNYRMWITVTIYMHNNIFY